MWVFFFLFKLIFRSFNIGNFEKSLFDVFYRRMINSYNLVDNLDLSKVFIWLMILLGLHDFDLELIEISILEIKRLHQKLFDLFCFLYSTFLF